MHDGPQDRGGRAEGGDDAGNSWDETELDEDFVREAEVSEPAARTRMLRERWRDSPPEPQPWRADEPPAGWFFSKARRRSRKKRRRDEG